jgi:hypothetical protein
MGYSLFLGWLKVPQLAKSFTALCRAQSSFIVQWVLQVKLPSACSFIVDVSCHCFTFSCHCFTLHVSAYMAIFRCVGYFYFHIPEGICFAGFAFFFALGHTLHVSICGVG